MYIYTYIHCVLASGPGPFARLRVVVYLVCMSLLHQFVYLVYMYICSCHISAHSPEKLVVCHATEQRYQIHKQADFERKLMFQLHCMHTCMRTLRRCIVVQIICSLAPCIAYIAGEVCGRRGVWQARCVCDRCF